MPAVSQAAPAVRGLEALIPGYRDGRQLPDSRAFGASLRLIFGDGGDLRVPMTRATYYILQENDAIKKVAA